MLFYDCIPTYPLMLNASFTTLAEVSIGLYTATKDATQMSWVPTFVRLRAWPSTFVA